MGPVKTTGHRFLFSNNMQNEEQHKRAVEAMNGKANMSRQQKRANERANSEAKDAFEGLVKQFWDVFFDNSPTDQIVIDKEKEVIAKWKMYCERRRLLPAAFTMVSEACKTIREDYEKAKAE